MPELAIQEVPLDSAATIVGANWPSHSQRDSESTVSTSLETAESDFNEITLDDDPRFSTVPLTAVPARKSFFEKIDEFRRRSAESVRASLVGTGKLPVHGHKKSLSEAFSSGLQFTPIHPNLSDMQEADASIDQPDKDDVQESDAVAVVQNVQPEEEEEHAVNGAIDWGTHRCDIRPPFGVHLACPKTSGEL